MRVIAYAVPAIEVVDSRIRDWKISIYDYGRQNHDALGFGRRAVSEG
jgi:2-keto-4-pentenoate hydratase